MVGSIVVPRDIHILITCGGVTLPGKRDFADVVKDFFFFFFWPCHTACGTLVP